MDETLLINEWICMQLKIPLNEFWLFLGNFFYHDSLHNQRFQTFTALILGFGLKTKLQGFLKAGCGQLVNFNIDYCILHYETVKLEPRRVTAIIFKISRPPLFAESSINPIWTGGGGRARCPLRVFAKYLKNSLANLYETLWLLRPIYRSYIKIKSLRIGHSLSSW